MLARVTTTVIPSTEQFAEARAASRSLMDEHIFPNENRFDLENEESDALIEELRARATAGASRRRPRTKR